MDNNTTIIVKQIPPDIQNIRHFYEFENIEITNRDEFETASAYFLQTKSHLKLVEAERVKITGPINESLRKVNDLFKRISDPLNKIRDKLNFKMCVFADGERKKLEDQKKAELAAEKAKFETDAKAAKKEAVELGSETALETAAGLQKRADSIDTQNVQVKQTVRLGAQGTMAERRTWQFRITDPTLVPREFLMVDEKKLREFMKTFITAKPSKDSVLLGSATASLPGVEFYQETSFSATTR